MNINMWWLIYSSIMLMQGFIVQSSHFDLINKENSRRKISQIVGGRDSQPGVRTYQVSLQNPGHFCGGSIINSRYILTAAHCLVGYPLGKSCANRLSDWFRDKKLITKVNVTEKAACPRLTVADNFWGISKSAASIKVVTGTRRLSKPYRTYKVSKVIINKLFNQADSFKNDIGLLQVDQPISFNKLVSAVRLPRPDSKVNDGDVVTVSGWGRLINGSKAERLQEVDLKIVNQEKCKRLLKKRKYNLYDTQLCVQDDDPSKRQGECNGDSGGPLISKGILIGIVSWSIKDPYCASNEYPGVFTRVSKFLDWIKEQM